MGVEADPFTRHGSKSLGYEHEDPVHGGGGGTAARAAFYGRAAGIFSSLEFLIKWDTLSRLSVDHWHLRKMDPS
jgi:hypothetical protein